MQNDQNDEKNKQKRYQKTTDPKAVNHVVCEFLVTKKRKRSTPREMLDRLKAIISDGVIDFEKDKKLKALIVARANKKGTTIEDELKSLGCETTKYTPTIKKYDVKDRLTDEMKREIVKGLANDKNEIHPFSDVCRPAYYNVRSIARREIISMESALNKFLGVTDGTYKYVCYSSIYDMNSDQFVGNDEAIAKTICKAIEACKDENNRVRGLSAFEYVYALITSIARRNLMGVDEVVSMFDEDALYMGHIFKRANQTEIAALIKSYDDGTGCVDMMRSNSNLMEYIDKQAQSEHISVVDAIKKYGDYHFSKSFYDVDYEQYIKVMLKSTLQGQTNASGLYAQNPKLYRIIKAYKNNFPGGAKRSMEEMFAYFGYDYGQYFADSEIYSIDYVGVLLNKVYGQNKNIERITDPKVKRGIYVVSGKLGLNIENTLKYYGYEYRQKREVPRNSKIYLTEAEYQDYLLRKRLYEESGEEISEEDDFEDISQPTVQDLESEQLSNEDEPAKN